MSARFVTNGAGVVDRMGDGIVCTARSLRWAELIADGLNMIIDEVTPLVPSVRHVDVLDGEFTEVRIPQQAIREISAD